MCIPFDSDIICLLYPFGIISFHSPTITGMVLLILSVIKKQEAKIFQVLLSLVDSPCCWTRFIKGLDHHSYILAFWVLEISHLGIPLWCDELLHVAVIYQAGIVDATDWQMLLLLLLLLLLIFLQHLLPLDQVLTQISLFMELWIPGSTSPLMRVFQMSYFIHIMLNCNCNRAREGNAISPRGQWVW